jgi:uncharacterized protein
MRISRRAFIKRTWQATLATGAIYSTLVEPWRVEVEKITVFVPGLPNAFMGFKIVQLSDLHYQPYTTLGQIAHAVALANALSPDLIALTGDYITRSSGAIEKLAPVLARLEARYGVTSVLGNHDFGAGAARVTESLRGVGIEVLRNQGRELQHAGASIYLAGVDSVCNGIPKLSEALAARTPGKPTILLAHEPDFVDLIPTASDVCLQLSGHSHGGQIRLPYLGAPLLPAWGKKYWRGLHTVNKTQLYTNRGIGTIFVPARIGSTPEITELTLAVG